MSAVTPGGLARCTVMRSVHTWKTPVRLSAQRIRKERVSLCGSCSGLDLAKYAHGRNPPASFRADHQHRRIVMCSAAFEPRRSRRVQPVSPIHRPAGRLPARFGVPASRTRPPARAGQQGRRNSPQVEPRYDALAFTCGRRRRPPGATLRNMPSAERLPCLCARRAHPAVSPRTSARSTGRSSRCL